MLTEYSFDDIYIRHASDDSPNAEYFRMHIHSRCEIFFFLKGKVDYLVEGCKYSLDENSMLIMRPGESHTAKILDSSTFERYALNFPENYFQYFDSENRLMEAFYNRPLGYNNLFTESDMDMMLVKRIFEEMINCKTDYDKQMIFHTHLPFLLQLINTSNAKRKIRQEQNPTKVERAIRFINNHLFKEITLNEIAENSNLSISQFTRIFKQATGTSPWEYVLRKRLTAAREQLKSGISTQEAAYNCGFSDYSAFYRAYIKYLHETPIQTRNKNKKSLITDYSRTK